MKQINGLADCEKMDTAFSDKFSQRITITDDDGRVRLFYTGDAVGLNPEQARYIAKMLIEAAQRVEHAQRISKLPSSKPGDKLDPCAICGKLTILACPSCDKPVCECEECIGTHAQTHLK